MRGEKHPAGLGGCHYCPHRFAGEKGMADFVMESGAAGAAPALTSVPEGSGSELPPPELPLPASEGSTVPHTEASAEQQRQSARELMRQETEPVSDLPQQQQLGGGGGAGVARDREERRVCIAAVQRDGASERRTGSGVSPAAGGRTLQPLRALRRSTTGADFTTAATAREPRALPRRAGGIPRAGSAPRLRSSGRSGDGGGAAREFEAAAKVEAAAHKRANKLLGVEVRRKSMETEAEVLELKKLAGNLEAELKRLKVEMQKKDNELRRHAQPQTRLQP